MNRDKPNDSTSAFSALSIFRGLYQRVAAKLGVDPSYVSRVARGERRSAAVSAALQAEMELIREHLNRELRDGKAGDGKARDGDLQDRRVNGGRAVDGKRPDGQLASWMAAKGTAAKGTAAKGTAAKGTARIPSNGSDAKAAD